MGRFQRRKSIAFAIDLLKCYVEADADTGCRLYGLSENSETMGFDADTYARFVPHLAGKEFEKYIEIIDRPTNQRLAFLLKKNHSNEGYVERKDVFEVTGTGCTMRPMKYWISFLRALRLEITGFKRVDIALDLELPTDYLCKKVFFPVLEARKRQTWKPYYKDGLATGAEIGEKNPKKNTWKYIRVYDKILDTREKKKEWLYGFGDRGIKELTRIELELRRDKCKHFHEEYLTDPDALYGIFKNEVFFLNWQFLKFIKEEDARRCWESHVVEEFGTWEKLSLTAGEKKAAAVRRLNRMVDYGNPFADEYQAKAIFKAYAKGLYVGGTTLEELCELAAIAVRENSPENAIFAAKKAFLGVLE